MSHDTLVLGVVGGGARTVAHLVSSDQGWKSEPIGIGKSAGANPSFLGMDSTLEHLDKAIQRAFENAGLSRGRVSSAVFALAGTEVDGALCQYSDWICSREIAIRADVVNDAYATLMAGCEDGWGVSLVAATGSVAFARSPEGILGTAGGWGWLLGDDGSGFRIALEGIRAAILAYDGRGPQTALMEAMLEAFDASGPAELVRMVYRFPGNLSSISEKSPVVTKAAGSGDAVACEIVRSSARQLAMMVGSLMRRPEFGWEEFPLAFAGGAFNDPIMRECLGESMRSLGLAPEMFHVQNSTAGAVRLACALAETDG
ncbi:MAG: BadF/BadG/BcrA/BcrD ATPase family protein [Planctomycetia bacterium]|nr:BadF/BadG/BcrA/BcrD ATPase family protein [Planctomycetia bacterium]